MNIVNKIYFNGSLCVFKFQRGQKHIIQLESGDEVFMGSITQVDIECTDCKSLITKTLKSANISKQYLCHKCSISGTRNPFYGKTHTGQSKSKMGGAVKDYSGKNNPMYGKSVYNIWVKKFGPDIAAKKLEDMKLKDRNSNLGILNGFYGKTHDVETIQKIKDSSAEWRRNLSNDEYVKWTQSMSVGQRRLREEQTDYYTQIKSQAARESHKSQFKNYKLNKIESIVYKFLQNNSSKTFIPSIILGHKQFDFGCKSDRILIEVDGDYWHGNPMFYSTDIVDGKRKLNDIQLSKIKSDAVKDEWAREHNFRLIRIWENEVLDGSFVYKLQEVL